MSSRQIKKTQLHKEATIIQLRMSQNKLSISEIQYWREYFIEKAKKYGFVNEFKSCSVFLGII